MAAQSLPALLPTIELETGPQPTRSVIWLHGLGADGHDFEAIVPALDLRGLPPVRFVFPNAPMRAVTVNGGYVMRAWFDILSRDFGNRREDVDGIQESAGQLQALVARENARGVDDHHIVLAGFSQGGAIALHTGLRHLRQLAGILALSTFLPLTSSLGTEAHAANRQTPIFMAHGESDPVIPFAFARQSADLLTRQGYAVDWHNYPMDHTVSMDEVADISVWFRRVLT